MNLITNLNKTPIEQIIKDLNEYSDAQAELQRLQGIHNRLIEGPHKDQNPRLEAAQLRFDSALAKIPSREQAEAAVLGELQQLGAEYYEVKSAFKSALWEELEAVQKRDAANQTVEYQQRWSILGLDPIKVTHAARDAQAALDKAIYGREVIGNRLDQVHQRTGANPDPAHFPAQAAGRVDALLGDIFARQHVASVKEQFGITDEMLARMGTT